MASLFIGFYVGDLSLSLPCSTGSLLAGIPDPLYSAVTPDSSPMRGAASNQGQINNLTAAVAEAESFGGGMARTDDPCVDSSAADARAADAAATPKTINIGNMSMLRYFSLGRSRFTLLAIGSRNQSEVYFSP